MRPDVARDIHQPLREIEHPPEALLGNRRARQFRSLFERGLEVVGRDAPMNPLGQETDHLLREPKCLAHVPHDSARAISADRRNPGDPVRAIGSGQVSPHRIALRSFEVDIDIGPLAAVFGKEPVEMEIVFVGVDPRKPQNEGRHGIDDRAASAEEDVVVARPPARIPNRQEVVREVQPADSIELVVEPALKSRRQPLSSQGSAGIGDFAEGLRGVREPRRHAGSARQHLRIASLDDPKSVFE